MKSILKDTLTLAYEQSLNRKFETDLVFVLLIDMAYVQEVIAKTLTLECQKFNICLQNSKFWSIFMDLYSFYKRKYIRALQYVTF